MNLGKLNPVAATEFVRANPSASLGSLSHDGSRRINGPASLIEAFGQVGGTDRRSSTTPEVSDVGTRIKLAIESAGGYTMTCGACLQYLGSLNFTTDHDTVEITCKLTTELQLSDDALKRIGGQKGKRAAIQRIVEEALGSS